MSIYKDPKLISRINKLNVAKKKALNKDHVCMLPNCHEVAINSHIIQRSRFLEPIANEYKKLMCLQTMNMYPGKLPKFQRIAVRGVLTFKGFCAHHDQQIFAEIEKNDFDLNSRKHLILFNYRALCHELRKKMIFVECMKDLLKDLNNFSPDEIPFYMANLQGFKLGIKDLEYYKLKIEEDLIQETKNYAFEVHKLARREIVTSACFNLENLTEEEANKVNQENWKNIPLKAALITIFPSQTETILVLGYLKIHTKEIDAFKKELGGISLKFINKILLEWVETWACSEQLYKNKIIKIEEELKNIVITSNVTNSANHKELPNILE